MQAFSLLQSLSWRMCICQLMGVNKKISIMKYNQGIMSSRLKYSENARQLKVSMFVYFIKGKLPFLNSFLIEAILNSSLKF